MSSNNSELAAMIQALALGSLSREEMKKLREEMSSGKEFPFRELGEYQNLAALLPSLLDTENPPHQLKDKVARKLYRIKDEVRAKRSNDKRPVPPPVSETPMQPPPPPAEIPRKEPEEIKPFTDDEARNLQDTQKFRVEGEHFRPVEPKNIEDSVPEMPPSDNVDPKDFEPVSPVRKTTEFFDAEQKKDENLAKPEEEKQELEIPYEPPVPPAPPPVKETPKSELKEKLKSVKEQKQKEEKPDHKKHTITYSDRYKSYSSDEPKRNTSLIVSIVLFAILAIAAAAIYWLLSNKVSSYQEEVKKLDAELRNLSGQLKSNEEIQSILESQNVRIINMMGTELNPYGQAKLIISFGTMKGYLQLSYMPPLMEGRVYTLWLNVNGNYTALGMFSPVKQMEYYPFDIPQLVNEEDAEFLLTEESKDGALRPSRNIYLTGYFH